ncbi:hypothetical protein VNO78_30953 [Psophocarpus tetragonolobus]|uniref:Nitrate reductase n=1 Tax=Psophocarpus tetragonolobus TaxID=3891 RepID=A0AAN9RZ00_PSOTE
MQQNLPMKRPKPVALKLEEKLSVVNFVTMAVSVEKVPLERILSNPTRVPDPYSSSSDDEEEEHDLYIKDLIKDVHKDLEESVFDPRDENTVDNWVKRNPSMVRLAGKHPFNAEAPMDRIMHYGFVTPAELHYVRNHGRVAKGEWENWTVEVSGLVKRPTSFTMNQLVNDFPHREFPVLIVCSGTRRKELNLVKRTSGSNMTTGTASNSVWRGVTLRHLLKKCGILSRAKGATHVCFEGAEDLPGGGGSKYGTSITREEATDPSRDIMLAFLQNGEPLLPDHGYPVRLILPGFIGGRMVKWLKRIVVANHESQNYYHYRDNKILPSHVDSELANEQGWWDLQEYCLYELNINSVIIKPSHNEILAINPNTLSKPYLLRGYSYSGGGRRVILVEVTLDGGATWRLTTLERRERPNKYGKYWSWCFWSLEVEVRELLVARDIAVRAWDEGHNTQPEHLNWNLMGMLNNSWYRVKTSMGKPVKGEIGIVFAHPCLPGNLPGGWMEKEKHIEISVDKKPSMKKSGSSPDLTATVNKIPITEVRKHNHRDSAWIIIHGHVYDATKFLYDHPGGPDSILVNAGTDCTEDFDAIHSERARKLLENFRIGEIITTGYESEDEDSAPAKESVKEKAKAKESDAAEAESKVALNPRQKIHVKLVSKTEISHDVRRFRFALPKENQVLGLPVGKHVFLYAHTDENNLVVRAYTPTSRPEEVGYFDLVVKIYFKGVHPKFPNGGAMSQYLESLEIGSVLDVKGPLGHIEYTGKGNFIAHGEPKFAKRLAMLAGGTGITPIYQVIQAVLKDPEDRTEMFLVYSNKTESDILLREELDAWAKKHSDRFKVWYVVDKAGNDWAFSTGRVNESIMRVHLPGPSDALALACGPPPMIQLTVQPSLENIGYKKDDVLVF